MPGYRIRRLMEALGPNPVLKPIEEFKHTLELHEDIVAAVTVTWPDGLGERQKWSFCLLNTGGIFFGYAGADLRLEPKGCEEDWLAAVRDLVHARD
jgi:hypothetical protein